ncbi:hypothetical protein MHJ95_02810 [Corynebacterium imitans]|uniref:hypothetical protein n=1 Tax=Corynebacterium imitans TaxID=156978 RepID=UPI001EF33142|nr:hypothetical protein [Corynebacterium imitans]MCG7277929.1 hypothetical protein [Corynebacterium imitans]
MKRTATAAIAAATALSLAVVPAYAEDAKDPGKDDTNASSNDNQGSSSEGEQQDGKKVSSSDITDEEAQAYYKERQKDATGLAKPKEGKEGEDVSSALLSSIKSDKANGWEPGKTANILLGTGIGALVLGILAVVAGGGAIPGLGNIKLPF